MAGDILFNRQEQGDFNLRKNDETSVDWANLPTELLVEIIENYLVSVDDYVAVSGVCRSWRKAAVVGCNIKRLKHNWDHRQMPWLLLTDTDEEILNVDGQRRSKSLLNLLRNRKKYNVNFPQGDGMSCWGLSHGWILTHHVATRNMYLFNPLTNTRLNLPSLPKPRYFGNYIVNRAALFKDGVDDDNAVASNLLVLIIYGNPISCAVAFAKPGDTQWTKFFNRRGLIIDALYRVVDGNATLLFLNKDGNLAHCHFSLAGQQSQPPLKMYDSKLELLHKQFWLQYSDQYNYIAYLVNSGEDLLMVLRMLELDQRKYDQDNIVGSYRTVYFRVYKFLFDAKRWEELEDLQDVALFVGNNETMSVCATHTGCEPNCIYFSDDYRGYYDCRGFYLGTEDRIEGYDMGVFRIRDKTIQPFDVQINGPLRSSYCSPLWFSPAL